MRKRISVLLAWLVAANACSGNTDPPPTDFDNCLSLCTEYGDLGCKYGVDHEDNRVAALVAFHSASCRESCSSLFSDPPPAPPGLEVCRQRESELFACAAEAGFDCLAGMPDAPPVVKGCDGASRALATACGACVLLLSSGTTDCPEVKPMRWVCATDEPPFACFPTCKEVSPGEFCCPDRFYEDKCDPTAAPFCADC